MNQQIHPCPQCGAAVIDRGLHGRWHVELERQRASADDHDVAMVARAS